MPRKVLLCKACGERSEDFSAARRKSNGIVKVSKKSETDFFDSLNRPDACHPGGFLV